MNSDPLNTQDSQATHRAATVIDNPLLAVVGEYVSTRQADGEAALSEASLLAWLRARGLVSADSLPHADLYKVHFLMRNALYRWANNQPQWRWQFSALGVSWQPGAGTDPTAQPLAVEQGARSLAEYYLDMANLNLSVDEVDTLLAGFWRRFKDYVAADGESLVAALALLEIEQLTDLASLKQQYRRRAMALHPDRGGSDSALQALNAAFDVARAHLPA